MHIKKLLMTATASLLLSVLFVTPVSAHGHHHSNTVTVTVSEECPVCTFDDCTETGRHLHDDKYYCGNEHENGYCDGSCENSCDNATKTYTRKHHRRHSCH